MELAFYLITEIYALLILGFILGFIKLNKFQLSKLTPVHKFSIIIPFRNEAKHLPELLESIAHLEYSKAYFEVLLIDDFSSDNSVKIIENFQNSHPEIRLKILQNESGDSPKKTAINLGIKQALHDWILTTDADCKVPNSWLLAYNEKIEQSRAKMICGPVKIETEKGFAKTFEILNFNSLQGATMGSFGWNHPIMCNGANLCYNKQAYYDVDGFSGNENIASGDDIFLLEKINKHYSEAIFFLKSRDAIVTTKPQDSLGDFINQQQRWAAKSKAYTNKFTQLVGGIIYIQNLSLILQLVLFLMNELNWDILVFSFVMKFVLDTILIYQSLHFYKQKKLAIASFPMSFVYPIFSVSMVFLSFFRNYSWKNRSFKS